jgi:double zinc ribbon protein
MARSSLLSRLRRPAQPPPAEPEQAAPAPDVVQPPPVVRRPLPPPGRLRRERRALLRAREERIRDLGGLVLEMVRRDDYRQDLVYEQCAELFSLEERLHELDTLLAASTSSRRHAPAARCSCGTPILWGSQFCANCGRSLVAAPAVACQSCGSAVPAGAQFCAACGKAVEAPDAAPAGVQVLP